MGKTKKNPSSQKGMPRGKVGGYGAPVDTTGMSPEDKRIFGFDEPPKTSRRAPSKPKR